MQLRRRGKEGARELRALEAQLTHSFWHYFVFLHASLVRSVADASEWRVLLCLSSADLFWRDAWRLALPGMGTVWAHQSIWKSLAYEQALARFRSGDAVCLFASLFGVDDVYVRLHSVPRAVHAAGDAPPLRRVPQRLCVLRRRGRGRERGDYAALERGAGTARRGRRLAVDVAAQVLALLVCVMRVLGANEAERAADGIKQLPRYGCFFVLRFETDLCDGGVRAVHTAHGALAQGGAAQGLCAQGGEPAGAEAAGAALCAESADFVSNIQ